MENVMEKWKTFLEMFLPKVFPVDNFTSFCFPASRRAAAQRKVKKKRKEKKAATAAALSI